MYLALLALPALLFLWIFFDKKMKACCVKYISMNYMPHFMCNALKQQCLILFFPFLCVSSHFLFSVLWWKELKCKKKR